jgi:hypothetical protein
VGGTTTYEVSKGDRVLVNLLGDCLIFIIRGGFTLDNGIDITMGRRLGYPIYSASVLILEPDIVVVIILGI